MHGWSHAEGALPIVQAAGASFCYVIHDGPLRFAGSRVRAEHRTKLLVAAVELEASQTRPHGLNCWFAACLVCLPILWSGWSRYPVRFEIPPKAIMQFRELCEGLRDSPVNQLLSEIESDGGPSRPKAVSMLGSIVNLNIKMTEVRIPLRGLPV